MLGATPAGLRDVHTANVTVRALFNPITNALRAGGRIQELIANKEFWKGRKPLHRTYDFRGWCERGSMGYE